MSIEIGTEFTFKGLKIEVIGFEGEFLVECFVKGIGITLITRQDIIRAINL